MLQLLDFLYRQRGFILFLILQGISFWLIFSYNHRYNTYYVNSSNQVTGAVSARVNSFETFLDLQRANQVLAEENLQLRRELGARIAGTPVPANMLDTAAFELISAKVVNTTHRRAKNFLTLRVNAEDSIKPGMGVISAQGIVGTVKSVSKHFATVTSILHPNMLVSARLKKSGSLCTVQWDGVSPLESDLKYVPRHLNLLVGDTVVTSGFDGVYPDGYMIGIVSKSELKRESPFHTASVNLATDFTKLRYGYIVKQFFVSEREELEEEVKDE